MHSVIRWLNSEPEAQREFGSALIDMMLEAGSSTRARNKGGLTPYQLVDPRNAALRDLIQRHEYATLNAGDFVEAPASAAAAGDGKAAGLGDEQRDGGFGGGGDDDDESDEDAEFSGSDDEERAEWERRRRERRAKKG